jgi:hypothetical protein
MDAGLPAHCLDFEPRIVSESEQARALRSRARLDECVLLEALARFLGLAQAEASCRHASDAMWRKQLAELSNLALVVASDDELGAAMERAWTKQR